MNGRREGCGNFGGGGTRRGCAIKLRDIELKMATSGMDSGTRDHFRGKHFGYLKVCWTVKKSDTLQYLLEEFISKTARKSLHQDFYQTL